MLYLPRGKTVRSQVNPARINLPQAMEKLCSGKFSGYLRFDAPQGSGVVLFQEGRLINAVYLAAEDYVQQIAYDALACIFEVSIMGEARLNIYHVSADLVISLHALLQGKGILQAEVLRKVDVSSLLQRIADERLSACIRVYAGNRTTLIFYDNGHALGFFLDGEIELLQSVDLSASVAAADDAHFDLFEIQGAEQQCPANLMRAGDLGSIWQRKRKQLLEERGRQEESVIRTQQ